MDVLRRRGGLPLGLEGGRGRVAYLRALLNQES
jgi:hypothetical protein